MKFSFRTKLALSFLLFITIAWASFALLFAPRLGKIVEGTISENLLVQVELAARAAHGDIVYLRGDNQPFAVSTATVTGSRVTVIDANGSVLADSEVARSQLKNLENHSDRPEIREAFRTGRGTAIRHSATLGTDMLYAAAMFQDKLQNRAVIRLALPLTAVAKTRAVLNSALGESLFISFALGCLFSVILARLNMRQLQRIAKIVSDIGQGNYSLRLPVDRHDELGGMAKSINEMAERIESQFIKLGNDSSQLNAILSGIGEGLMVGDSHGTITLVNTAFSELFAVHENIVGRSLITISRHPSLHDSFKMVIKNKCEHKEEIVISGDRERVVRVHWVPLLDDDRLLGIVAVFHDISDLKRLENVRKDFVANVSHELRTPVTIIKGYAETLLGGVISDNPANVQQFVEIIHNNAERLANLLRDLLSLSEMESDEFILDLQPLPLGMLVKQACLLLEAKASAKSITIINSDNIGELPLVMANAGRLEQVLINLIDNAIKYSPAGSSITISAEEQDAFVKVSLSDNGNGIPPQSLPRIFERFYRVDAGRSRAEGGTGLGLSIVKHTIQLHGGSITCESTIGKGTTFHFTLRKAETKE
ncbi:HAMP domain-containing protein [Geobacter pelophilus]|uniref:histidine kinase n=1 Tax=Geoanaerobacter pelophilus TaxID=60036 RepID=A0AAW4LAT1_9BACT|nr:ATP-binding protein [Geoanaerobacter pelophilus]MBT0666203.1 HAMP domain-containing protein [Geoanaerobacter pelophilus]